MKRKLAGAPITWGISEVPGWGRQLDRNDVLEGIASVGFTATELGPRGFLPENPAELSALLERYGLSLIAGFVPAVLHRLDRLDEQLECVHESAVTLAAAGAETLVLAADTGRGSYERSASISSAEWDTLRDGIAAVERLGRNLGLTVALHPHYGTLIEDDEDVRRILEDTSVSLCLDTGHLVLGGADPLAVARAAAGRIALVHLKDVNAAMARRVRAGTLGYREAVSQGLYRPLGVGDVCIVDILRVLDHSGYDGWYVIEQDLVIPEHGSGDEPLRNARQSVAFLEAQRQRESHGARRGLRRHHDWANRRRPVS
jgi:inosose dehydratase